MKTVHNAQKTIAKEGTISGIGIHTGAPSRVVMKPAAVGAGIQFLKNGKKIETAPERADGARCTSVGEGKNQIQTVEHLLATLAGLGITNILINVEGPEIPALDGSAEPFVRLFKGLGLLDQKEEKEVFRVREPIFCCENGKAISIYPADEFSISYTLDYDHPRLKNQKVDFTVTPDIFEKEIAPARTFCTEKEGLQLRKNGFGLGASLQNTLVISDNGASHQALRFSDECARHKVLDILGDMNLLGFSVLGHVVGLRSGHSLNRKLIKAISLQRDSSPPQRVGGPGNGNQQRGVMSTKKDGSFSKKLPIELEQIKKILPHRYPFLFVDRILEMHDKKIVAIKNVSGSEPFFQGHFPDKPVMPGVLMIEALAQAGGVLILSKSEYHGKLAYLVAVNNARFRRTVVPGDQLRLEVELTKIKAKIALVQCVAKVGGEEACSAEIMFAVVD